MLTARNELSSKLKLYQKIQIFLSIRRIIKLIEQSVFCFYLFQIHLQRKLFILNIVLAYLEKK